MTTNYRNALMFAEALSVLITPTSSIDFAYLSNKVETAAYIDSLL